MRKEVDTVGCRGDSSIDLKGSWLSEIANCKIASETLIKVLAGSVLLAPCSGILKPAPIIRRRPSWSGTFEKTAPFTNTSSYSSQLSHRRREQGQANGSRSSELPISFGASRHVMIYRATECVSRTRRLPDKGRRNEPRRCHFLRRSRDYHTTRGSQRYPTLVGSYLCRDGSEFC